MAYEEAPTHGHGYLSVASKAASIAFLLRDMPRNQGSGHNANGMVPILSVVAVMTLTLGIWPRSTRPTSSG